MAANFIDYDRTTEVGRQLNRALALLREGRDLLTTVRAILIQMRDGDGSLTAHYDLVAAELGYQPADYADNITAAKASFDELDSLWAKVATDGATSNVATAISQACAKHGV